MRTIKITALVAMLLLGSSARISAQGFLGGLKNLLGGSSTATEQNKDASSEQSSSTDNAKSSGGLDISSALGSLGSVGEILNSVIGNGSVQQTDIIGTWNYSEPACAFTSQDLLAKAGGTVASNKVEDKMSPLFTRIGMNSSNTSFTFNQDKTFTAKISGKSFSGTYDMDSSTGKINLNGKLFSAPCYVTRSGDNLNLLFDTSKLLTLFRNVAKFTDNSTLKTISSLSESFDGMRMGIGYKK